jgi:hypothetical protein
MEVLGAAVTAVQILEGFKKLVDAFRQIRGAHKHIAQFYRQTRTFIGVVEQFFDCMKKYIGNADSIQTKKLMETTEEIKCLFHDVRSDLDTLISKVAARDSENRIIFPNYLVRIVWYLKESSVKHLRYMMEVVKTTAILYGAVSGMAYLQREIEELKARNEPVPRVMQHMM